MGRIKAWGEKGEILEGGNGNAKILIQSRPDRQLPFLLISVIMDEWVERAADGTDCQEGAKHHRALVTMLMSFCIFISTGRH